MCFSCFASENGVMLPAPPDSLQTWRPRAIDYRVMCDSLNRVGGMLNRYDIRRNIDLIRSLYPQVENIALVTDNTYGGISLQALVRAEWENYPDLNLVLVDSREGEETAFRTYATLPPRSAVMLGTWRVGSDGEYFMQRSLNDLVQNNPRVPVFSVTGTGIGDTAIGRIRERRGGHCEPDPEILRHGRHRRRSFPYEQKSLSVRFAQAQGVENR